MYKDTERGFLRSVIRGALQESDEPVREFLMDSAWKMELPERAAVYRASVALRGWKSSPTGSEQLETAVIQALEISRIYTRRRFSS